MPKRPSPPLHPRNAYRTLEPPRIVHRLHRERFVDEVVLGLYLLTIALACALAIASSSSEDRRECVEHQEHDQHDGQHADRSR